MGAGQCATCLYGGALRGLFCHPEGGSSAKPDRGERPEAANHRTAISADESKGTSRTQPEAGSRLLSPLHAVTSSRRRAFIGFPSLTILTARILHKMRESTKVGPLPAHKRAFLLAGRPAILHFVQTDGSGGKSSNACRRQAAIKLIARRAIPQPSEPFEPFEP
jgi:hypothetical protein